MRDAAYFLHGSWECSCCCRQRRTEMRFRGGDRIFQRGEGGRQRQQPGTDSIRDGKRALCPPLPSPPHPVDPAQLTRRTNTSKLTEYRPPGSTPRHATRRSAPQTQLIGCEFLFCSFLSFRVSGMHLCDRYVRYAVQSSTKESDLTRESVDIAESSGQRELSRFQYVIEKRLWLSLLSATCIHFNF